MTHDIYSCSQRSCVCRSENCNKWSQCCFLLPVCEVVHTLQLSTDRDPRDVMGDLSVCLDGMQVDPETFASAERTGEKHKPGADTPGENN